MNRDYCYVCDRETEWDAQEVCAGCGRTWGHDADQASADPLPTPGLYGESWWRSRSRYGR